MADKTLNVLTICGSLRKGSYNRLVMNALPSLAPAGMSFKEAPPYAGFPHFNADDMNATGFPAPVTALADAIRAADGVIINTPEYNYSLPGALKNAIDWVSRIKDQPFGGKPIAIQSASPGPLGGGRVQYHLRTMLVFLNSFVFNTPEIFVGNCISKFDEKTGELTDETTRKFITQQLAGFAKLIERVTVKS
jgi:chromate reductase, NAD(P)H dehydrogenase (quinone)